jgi:hypothetical protein
MMMSHIYEANENPVGVTQREELLLETQSLPGKLLSTGIELGSHDFYDQVKKNTRKKRPMEFSVLS